MSNIASKELYSLFLKDSRKFINLHRILNEGLVLPQEINISDIKKIVVEKQATRGEILKLLQNLDDTTTCFIGCSECGNECEITHNSNKQRRIKIVNRIFSPVRFICRECRLWK